MLSILYTYTLVFIHVQHTFPCVCVFSVLTTVPIYCMQFLVSVLYNRSSTSLTYIIKLHLMKLCENQRPGPLPALQYLLKSTDYGPSVDWQGSANQSLAVVTRGQRGIHLASTHQSFECHDCWQLFLIEQKLNYSFMSGFYFSSGQTGLSAYKLTLSSVMFTKNPLLLALLLIRTIWLEIRSHKNINMINVHFIIQPKINKANRGSMG